MDFVYLFIACAFFALQFIFQKLFEERTKSGLSVCLWNQIACSVVGLLFILVKTGGAFSGITASGIICGLLYSASGIICSVATISSMSCGSVGTVGTYSLAGGMIVPFFYGILFLGEEAGLLKWLGIIILCASLIPSVMKKDGEKTNVKFIIYAMIVFMTNGFVSVFSKMHQIAPDAMEENSFLLLTGAMRLAAVLVIMLGLASVKTAMGDRKAFADAFWNISRKLMTWKIFAALVVFSGALSVCNTLGNLFSLRCMVTMDASIQFPLLSAVVIILTALFGRIFFGEKFTRGSVISLVMSAAGIGMFMIP